MTDRPDAPLPAPDERSGGESVSDTLILGYGNPDREDDGAAWHILDRLANRFLPDSGGLGDETFLSSPTTDLMFSLQLMPEMAAVLARYRRVCFIDAHTGAQPEDFYWEKLTPVFQASPFTHHMTPNTLLSITETLYSQRPIAYLAAIRGYQFGFDRKLSAKTAALIVVAERQILEWLRAKQP